MKLAKKWVIGIIGAILMMVGVFMIVAGVRSLKIQRDAAEYNRIVDELKAKGFYDPVSRGRFGGQGGGSAGHYPTLEEEVEFVNMAGKVIHRKVIN